MKWSHRARLRDKSLRIAGRFTGIFRLSCAIIVTNSYLISRSDIFCFRCVFPMDLLNVEVHLSRRERAKHFLSPNKPFIKWTCTGAELMVQCIASKDSSTGEDSQITLNGQYLCFLDHSLTFECDQNSLVTLHARIRQSFEVRNKVPKLTIRFSCYISLEIEESIFQYQRVICWTVLGGLNFLMQWKRRFLC